ncbi:hypothetical protein H2200_000925 [Cladophialophora chaetospira]|uniref:Fe2OG dioxygenase domain-containing protein n=1 Tax=Cladophialophora chaetospira TaxID=386627 RepID=A0AA38XQH0_9EURO|nr:hypothetical protein H2200_000925 [Cladophialophora chaetospira]
MGDTTSQVHFTTPKRTIATERTEPPVGQMPTSIPTIDLSLASSPHTRPTLLTSLRHALLNIGFLYISNHGISTSIIQDLLDTLPPLFSLSDEVKKSAALVHSPHFLGYSSFGHETTAGQRDQREQFEFANEGYLIGGRKSGAGEKEKGGPGDVPLELRLLGPNQWPEIYGDREAKLRDEGLGRLRETVKAYIVALQDLADRFLDLVEEALEVKPGVLKGFTGPQDRLKLVHYRSSSPPPSQNGSTANKRNGEDGYIQGVGPHKDSSGWMTFLLQTQPSPPLSSSSSIPSTTSPNPTQINGRGLQVLTKTGSWIDVSPIPSTFVVNMGQAFEVVTNGLCKATTHRVLLPTGGFERYSVPFFQGVRPVLTKKEFMTLWEEFEARRERWEREGMVGKESEEGMKVDSPFLRGKYETWGEAQLRTKIRSHRDVGRRWHGDVFERYVNDNG